MSFFQSRLFTCLFALISFLFFSQSTWSSQIQFGEIIESPRLKDYLVGDVWEVHKSFLKTDGGVRRQANAEFQLPSADENIRLTITAGTPNQGKRSGISTVVFANNIQIGRIDFEKIENYSIIIPKYILSENRLNIQLRFTPYSGSSKLYVEKLQVEKQPFPTTIPFGQIIRNREMNKYLGGGWYSVDKKSAEDSVLGNRQSVARILLPPSSQIINKSALRVSFRLKSGQSRANEHVDLYLNGELFKIVLLKQDSMNYSLIIPEKYQNKNSFNRIEFVARTKKTDPDAPHFVLESIQLDIQNDEYKDYRFVPPGRVVAVGDLHGDLEAARLALSAAGAISRSRSSYEDEWIGNNLTVVQVGDLVDRWIQDEQTVEYLERVSARASAFGGKLIILNGNHELLNADSDFSFAHRAALQAGSPYSKVFDNKLLNKNRERVLEKAKKDLREKYQKSRGPKKPKMILTDGKDDEIIWKRIQRFAPGQYFSRIFSEHPLFIIVGDAVFVHGGIRRKHLDYGLIRMDNLIRSSLSLRSLVFPKEILDLIISGAGEHQEGITWTRKYSEGSISQKFCDELAEVLAELSVKRMVVGHSVQEAGINSECEGKVWRIDVGMTEGLRFKSWKNNVRPVEVLELREGQAPQVIKR